MARKYQNIKQRNNGKYELRFTVNGKRYSVYGSTQQECKQKELEKRKEIEAGIISKSMSLNNYFEDFIRRKEQTVKKVTVLEYKHHYKNHIQPSIGNLQLKNIERRHCLMIQKEVAEKVSGTSANMVMTILHSILKGAVADELIMKNPCDNIPAIRTDKGKTTRETNHRALTVQETMLFLDEIADEWNYELFVFLFTTGCRIGEACALHWNDLDLKHDEIHICRTITRGNDNKPIEGDSTKTETSNRVIPMCTTARQAIDSQLEKMTARFGEQKANGYVFLSMTGKMMYCTQVNEYIYRVCARIRKHGQELENFSAHATRDTFATRCCESGMNLNTLKTILGHSSITMTADLYAHVLQDTKQREMLTVNTGIVMTAQRAMA